MRSITILCVLGYSLFCEKRALHFASAFKAFSRMLSCFPTSSSIVTKNLPKIGSSACILIPTDSDEDWRGSFFFQKMHVFTIQMLDPNQGWCWKKNRKDVLTFEFEIFMNFHESFYSNLLWWVFHEIQILQMCQDQLRRRCSFPQRPFFPNIGRLLTHVPLWVFDLGFA